MSIEIRNHESYFVDLRGFAVNDNPAFMFLDSVFNSPGRNASTNLIVITAENKQTK